jgi:DnaJ homolog subfamily C member 8
LDEKQRASLDESIADARMLLMRDKGWNPDDHSEELQSDEFKTEWKEKAKWVIMENEGRLKRQRKAQMQEEGRQQRKEEEELEERKRKRDHKESWEATRDSRIGSWRQFQNGEKPKAGAADGAPEKKKKKKLKVLA